MEIADKQIKVQIHQTLNKNGFYRLPLHKLTQILQLLRMPIVKQAKLIQQNTIQGLIRLIKKINSSKNINKRYFSEEDSQRMSIQVKNYLSTIVEQLLENNKNKNKSMNPQQNIAQNPFLSMRYPVFQNQLQYHMNPNSKGATSQMQQRMKMEMQMQMYYMNMYNFGNVPPGMNRNYYEHQDSQQRSNVKEKIKDQNLKQDYREEKDQQHDQQNYQPFKEEVSKARKENQLQLRPNFSQESQFHNKTNKQIRVQTTQIEIQTDLTLLYQQIQVFPKTKEKKIKKERIKKQRKPKKNPVQNIPIKKAQQKIGRAQQKLALAQQKQDKSQVKEDKNYFVTLNQDNFYNEQNINQLSQLRKRETQFQKMEIKVNESLKNVLKSPNLLKNCVCQGSKSIKQSFECLTCKNWFHYSCLRYQLSEKIQECPLCKLLSIDPINETKETVGTYYIEDLQNNKFQVEVSFGQYEYFLSKKLRSHQIELRCLRLGNILQSNDIIWPDEVWITINEKLVFQIQGLTLSSSLKRRRDNSLTVTSQIFHNGQQYNNVKIGMQVRPLTNQDLTTKHINNSHLFLFGIYFVQKLTKQALISKYQANLKPYSYDFINSLMNFEDQQIEIEKVVCNIEDPFSKRIIDIPVRGSKCKHGQCFDLKTFLSLMYISKNRQWKCPVCNKQSKTFLLDKQILQIIKKQIEQNLIPNEISFMKDGKIILRVSKQENNQQEQSSQPINPTKKKVKRISKRKKAEQGQQQLQQQK